MVVIIAAWDRLVLEGARAMGEARVDGGRIEGGQGGVIGGREGSGRPRENFVPFCTLIQRPQCGRGNPDDVQELTLWQQLRQR